MPDLIETPQIVQAQPEHYAYIHLQIPRAEMHAALPPALQELHAAFHAHNLPIRPWFAHHRTLADGDFDFDVCLPLLQFEPHPFHATGRIQPGLWAAGIVARTYFQGDYPGLPAAWSQFSQWLRANGHAYAGHIYERYVVNRHTTKNPAEFRTEMSWPLLVTAAPKEQA